MSRVVGVADYGCGNLRNLENALQATGFSPRRVGTPEGLLGLERVVLPGVGHFGHAAAGLSRTGLDAALRYFVATGGKILGICLGMQLLFQGSEEAPKARGISLLPGRFTALPAPGLKIPHMGWNTVAFTGGERAAAYFVHSYCLPAWGGPRPEWLGWSQYGAPFVSAFRTGPLTGCQFHPERSGDWGLGWLKEVLTWK